jgi:hypothetical protein
MMQNVLAAIGGIVGILPLLAWPTTQPQQQPVTAPSIEAPVTVEIMEGQPISVGIAGLEMLAELSGGGDTVGSLPILTREIEWECVDGAYAHTLSASTAGSSTMTTTWTDIYGAKQTATTERDMGPPPQSFSDMAAEHSMLVHAMQEKFPPVQNTAAQDPAWIFRQLPWLAPTYYGPAR